MDDEHLLMLVCRYEELYNTADKRYTNNIHKEKVWRTIGQELNTTGYNCKKRWISLRDQFRKALKKHKTNGEEPALVRKKWRYEDAMTFVIPFLREREKHYSEDDNMNFDDFSNRPHEYSENSNDVDVDIKTNVQIENLGMPYDNAQNNTAFICDKPVTSEVISPEVIKYVIQHIEKENNSLSKAVHPIDAFFNGLSATVKQFTPYYQSVAKSRIFAIVSELEMTQILNRHPENTESQHHDTVPQQSLTFRHAPSPSQTSNIHTTNSSSDHLPKYAFPDS